MTKIILEVADDIGIIELESAVMDIWREHRPLLKEYEVLI